MNKAVLVKLPPDLATKAKAAAGRQGLDAFVCRAVEAALLVLADSTSGQGAGEKPPPRARDFGSHF